MALKSKLLISFGILSLMVMFMSLVSAISINITDPNQIDITSPNYYNTDSMRFKGYNYATGGDSELLVDFDRTLAFWYRFNKESGESDTYIKDWSTYDKHISLNAKNKNNPKWSTTGKFGSSYYFDGKKDGIDLKDSLIPNKNSFTLSIWFNADKDNVAQDILSQSTNKKGDFLISYNKRAVTLKFDSGKNGKVVSSAKYDKNIWHNIVVIYDYDGKKIYLYIDGNFEGSASFEGVVSQKYDTIVGKRKGDKTSFKGYIDDVQIYSRALGEDEIKALYNGTQYAYINTFSGLLNKSNFTIRFYGQDSNGKLTNTSNMLFEKRLDYIPLTSCGVLSQSGYYKLVNNVASAGTCFTIDADSIILNGQGYRINYSQSSAGIGINVLEEGSGRRSNIVIKNLLIEDAGQISSTGAAINITNATNVGVYNNTIKTYGQNGAGIIFRGKYVLFLNNFSIVNNTINTMGFGSPGIKIISTRSSSIESNNISTFGSSSNGIHLGGTVDIRLRFNQVRSSGSISYAAEIVNSDDQFITTTENNTIYYNNFTTTGSNSPALLIWGSRNNFSINTLNATRSDVISTAGVSSVVGNIFTHNTIFSRASHYQLVLDTDNGDSETMLINQHVTNYSFNFPGSLIEMEQTLYGKISFLRGVTGSGTNLSAEIQILNNTALINSTINPGLNRSANITFYHLSGWGFTDNARIYRDGQICGRCYNFTPLTADTIVFNVSGSGRYYLQ